MGGEIAEAVKDVRQQGLMVISLNMAGGVPDAADLAVSAVSYTHLTLPTILLV